MTTRLHRVLDIAYKNGHRRLVLGAFGCGVFRNEPTDVARIFHHLLIGETAPYHGCFDHIIFAIYASASNVKAFRDVFAHVLSPSH
jgi:uncharacterized protein (TIGR02452 family)